MEKFGRYELMQRLAVGGMAEVNLARELSDQGVARVVVVKRILDHLSLDPEYVKLFMDEARLASLIEHPNVVKVYGAGSIDDVYYMAMEWLVGRDVREIGRRLRDIGQLMPVSMVCQVFHDAARGLHGAHRATDEEGNSLDIVHRDISPHNLFITVDGLVKILDFGVAQSRLAEESPEEKAEVIRGKASYMSPEQLVGETLDGRSDIFSLAIVMYELLVGERLFKLSSADAIYRAMTEDPFPIPTRDQEPLDEDLVMIFTRALQPNRELRYESAEALAKDLERVLERVGKVGKEELASYITEIFEAEDDDTQALGGKTAISKWVEEPTFIEDTGPPTLVLNDVAQEIRAAQRPSRIRFAMGLAALLAVGAGGAWALRGAQFWNADDTPPTSTPVSGSTTPTPPPPPPLPPPTPRSAPGPEATPVATKPPVTRKPKSIRRRPPRKPPPARPPEEKGPGWLTLQAIPWATVYVDGKQVGPTPLVGHELSSGRHRVKLVTEGGSAKALTVNIAMGKTTKRTVHLD